MSALDLIRVLDEVDNWSKERCIPNSVTNEWGLTLSGGGETDACRLTLVLALLITSLQ